MVEQVGKVETTNLYLELTQQEMDILAQARIDGAKKAIEKGAEYRGNNHSETAITTRLETGVNPDNC